MMAWICTILGIIFCGVSFYAYGLLTSMPADTQDWVRLTYTFRLGLFVSGGIALLAIGTVFWWRASKERN